MFFALDAALKGFQKAIQDDPDWPPPHVALVALYYRLKRTEDSKREQAIVDRLNSQHPQRESAPPIPGPQPPSN